MRKAGGAKGAKVPKLQCTRVAWKNAGFTWIGVFLTVLALSGVDQGMKDLSDGSRFVILGSFGALMTLMYSAPGSPLVQPRNVFIGSTLSASIAIVLNYLSDPDHVDGIPDWLNVAIAPATSIAAMQICGVTHPPAGTGCISQHVASACVAT